MIIEINIFLCEQLISMFIMGCPGGKINMAAVSAKRSMKNIFDNLDLRLLHIAFWRARDGRENGTRARLFILMTSRK